MRFHLVGNRLCIDFANTVVAPRGGDGLSGWADLVEFLSAAAAVDPAEGRRLRALEAAAPREVGRALALARALRDAVRRILDARVTGRRLDPAWLAPVNAALAAGGGHEVIELTRGGARRRFVARRGGPEAALAPVARSAAELLEEGPGAPVRRCGNPRCVLYFYDASRTGRRRWCSMAVCGRAGSGWVWASTARRRRPRAACSRRGLRCTCGSSTCRGSWP
jgi:predicted RNA-binding Zn ribbon-like protein